MKREQSSHQPASPGKVVRDANVTQMIDLGNQTDSSLDEGFFYARCL